MKTRSGWVIFSVMALIGVAVAALSSLITKSFEPPRRMGPPWLISHENDARLWIMLKQEEHRSVRSSTGRRSSSSTRLETWYHFEVQCHDPQTTKPLWKKRLLTLKSNQGGHGAEARIFGQQGGIVWIFLKDQLLAISPADASVIADRATIEKRNPQLAGMLSLELDFYAFDGAMIITTADARRYKLDSADFSVTPYTPENEHRFSYARQMSTRWNGGFQTSDFLTSKVTQEGEWIALFSEREATDAKRDSSGDHYKDADKVLKEGSHARRGFWKASIGQTREFRDGIHTRIVDLTRLPGTTDYLQGGLLVAQGTKQPLILRDPEGFLLLHRTRIDAEGRLALTRLGSGYREVWTTKYPFAELLSRWERPDYLLMLGSVEEKIDGYTQWHEYLVSTSLKDGRIQAWNITLEQEAE